MLPGVETGGDGIGGRCRGFDEAVELRGDEAAAGRLGEVLRKREDHKAGGESERFGRDLSAGTELQGTKGKLMKDLFYLCEILILLNMLICIYKTVGSDELKAEEN